MTFATPIALLFLGLFIPTILFYLLKQRRRRVEVSTLMFWDQILRDEQTVTSLTKLRKWLSLLLQLLFIALLTLALARPLLSGKITGARRIILFIDTSASMLVKEGKETRFDRAKRQALDIVRGMSIGDSLMAIAVAAEPDVLYPFTDHKKELRQAIERLEPVQTETNFKKALHLLELLPTDSRETHVYIVSDGAFEPVTIPPLPQMRFAYVRVGANADNIGITSFQVRPLPATPRDFQVHLEITNHSSKDQKVPVELRINGQLVDAYEYPIAARKSVIRTLRQYSAQGGEVELILGVDDAFALDNRAFALLPPPKPIQVKLVTENNVFLERALSTDDGIELEVVPPGKYAPTSPADVTVFAGFHPAQTPLGNSIFVGDWPDDLGLIRKGEVTKPIFTEWQREHPINRHLALQNVSIEKSLTVEAPSGFEKLATSFNDPLILLRDSGGRKVLVTLFDTSSSDLPLRVAFPILLANAVRYLTQAETTENWANPATGTILSPSEWHRYLSSAARTNVTNVSPTVVLDPDGKEIRLGPAQLVGIMKSGIYRARDLSGATTPVVAANLASPTESRIEPSEVLPVRASQGELAQVQGGFRLGFEPWFFLVAVGLVLSTVEWGLFHRRITE